MTIEVSPVVNFLLRMTRVTDPVDSSWLSSGSGLECFMEPAHADLAEALFREKVLRARQQTPSEKWALCFELHDLAIATMRAGIMTQHPGLDEAGIAAELDRRLRIRRQLEEHGIYIPIPDDGTPS